MSGLIGNILGNLKNKKLYNYGIFLQQFQMKKPRNNDTGDIYLTFSNSCSFPLKINKLEGGVYSISKITFKVYV